MKTNKLQMTVLIIAGLAMAQTVNADQTINPAGNPVSQLQPVAEKADNPALMEPVKSVYDNYLKIQTALTRDSLEGVAEKAGAMAKAIKGDEMKMLSADIAKQAEILAQATDLKTARKAFKPLSDSLIKYLADHKVESGSYNEAYCPMVEASWLQSGGKINNPYMGKSMPGCGEIKRKF
jgi:membrane fusion protein, copper/silver efflux system